ncbi:hypothetical protein FB451DRAFT_1175280 [Mycena latifolia]|nr:hypothetical protein FB451DRAFT_1175280 [Mycena latifolia]
MPLVTRQRMLYSVLSWWSDSIIPGSTINLHALKKPLMKRMYHRQATELHVVLEDLAMRAAFSEAEARLVANSLNMVCHLLPLVEWPSYELRWNALWILSHLAKYNESTAVAITITQSLLHLVCQVVMPLVMGVQVGPPLLKLSWEQKGSGKNDAAAARTDAVVTRQ